MNSADDAAPVSRRLFLLGAANLAGAATLGLTSSGANSKDAFACALDFKEHAGAEVAALVEELPIIDAHCHIFNAADIPAYQWLKDVAVAEIAEQNGLNAEDGWKLVEQSLAQVFGIAFNTASVAPGFAQEIVFIAYLRKHNKLPAYLADSRTDLTSKLDREFFHDYFNSILLHLKTPPAGTPNGRQRGAVIQTKNKVYLRSICRLYGIDYDKIVASDRKELRRLVDKHVNYSHSTLKLFAQPDKSEQERSNVGTMQRFLGCQARLRIENAIIFRSLFSVGKNKPALFTPAQLDIRYWLNAERPACTGFGDFIRPNSFTCDATSQLEQAEIVKDLSALFEGQLHGFFGFCPWRQVDFEKNGGGAQKSPLIDTRDRNPLTFALPIAINDWGFLGIKLYPPMGFRPIANNELDANGGNEFPAHLFDDPQYAGYRAQFGSHLDEALLRLYEFCVDNDVPIMAHCGHTNAPHFNEEEGTSYAKRASPEFWLRLLSGKFTHANTELADRVKSKIGRLRLNLGHFGFLGEKPKFLQNPKERKEDDWAPAMAELLRDYPNVYADVSYIVDPFSGRAKDDPCGAGNGWFKFMQTFLAHPEPDTGVWRKLLYGSDWYMTSLEKFHWNGLNVMGARWSEIPADKTHGPQEVGAFLCANAVRFLGLEPPADPAAVNSYTRLKKFYETEANFSTEGRARALARLESYAAATKRVFG